MGKYFRTVPRMGPLDEVTTAIMSCLNSALDGLGSITVRASKKGISISLGGAILAKGKTPDELLVNFKTHLHAAKQSQPSEP